MRLTWEYIAGFFDGEGCVSTPALKHHPGSFTTTVIIGQSGKEGKEVLTDLRAFLWALGIKSYVLQERPRPTHKRPMYRLQIMARESVIGFLTGIAPYVRVKRVPVRDTLRFHKLFPRVNGILSAERARARGDAALARLPVQEIKAAFSAGASRNQLAQRYRTSVTQISKCVDSTFLERRRASKARCLAKKAAAAA